MKTISKFFAIAMAASLTLTACEEMLDLQPEGATKTNALKQDAYEKKPENAVLILFHIAHNAKFGVFDEVENIIYL